MSTAKTSKPEPKQHAHEHVRSITLTAPAVRMVVVHAYSNNGVPRTRIAPVVAIETTITDHYARLVDRPGEACPYAPGTPELLEKDGWWFDHTEANHDPITMTEGYDPYDELAGMDHAFRCGNAASKVVVCPWSFEEDEVRLAKVIDDVENQSVENERKSGLLDLHRRQEANSLQETP
jgi:hypothetical protein